MGVTPPPAVPRQAYIRGRAFVGVGKGYFLQHTASRGKTKTSFPYEVSSKNRWQSASVAVARRLGSRVSRVFRSSPMPVLSAGAVISYNVTTRGKRDQLLLTRLKSHDHPLRIPPTPRRMVSYRDFIDSHAKYCCGGHGWEAWLASLI